MTKTGGIDGTARDVTYFDSMNIVEILTGKNNYTCHVDSGLLSNCRATKGEANESYVLSYTVFEKDDYKFVGYVCGQVQNEWINFCHDSFAQA